MPKLTVPKLVKLDAPDAPRGGWAELKEAAGNILSVDILREANRIPRARVELASRYDPKSQQMGRPYEKELGLGDALAVLAVGEDWPEGELVFRGVVVRRGLRNVGGTLILALELRDWAAALTRDRRTRVFYRKSDAQIIRDLVQQADAPGLTLGQVEPTDPVHAEMVQFGCTDWDFLVARAEANAMWVLVKDGELSVRSVPGMVPEGAPEGVQEIAASQILGFELEADAAGASAGAEVHRWSHHYHEPEGCGAGTLAEVKGKLAGLKAAPGVGTRSLLLPLELDPAEGWAWAAARWVRDRISTFRGHLTLGCRPHLRPGQAVAVSGINETFDGLALVSGVRHQALRDGWKTHLQLGRAARWFSASPRVSAPPAGALLPAAEGLHYGVVTGHGDEQGDPDPAYRVRVRIPSLEDDHEVWARLLAPTSGQGHGFVFRPEEGDEVILGFLADDPRQAVILGALHSDTQHPGGYDLAQGAADACTRRKGLVTGKGMELAVDEEARTISIGVREDPQKVAPLAEVRVGAEGIVLAYKDAITVALDDQGVSITDGNNNALVMNSEGVEVSAGGGSGTIKLKGATVDSGP